MQVCNNADPALSPSCGKSPTSSHVVVHRRPRNSPPTAPPVDSLYHLLQDFIAGRFGGQMAVPYDMGHGGDPLSANPADDHHTDASERRVSPLQIPHHVIFLIVTCC